MSHVEATADFGPGDQLPQTRAAAAAAMLEAPGREIGPYKLLKLLGEGGFGAVWLADQREPVQRRVAIKVLKAGMDTGEVLSRFEAERQALALMNHPHIAKVLDAGSTPAGRPYFVMEYVAGVPVNEYCDQRRLTTRQRLEMFVAICGAVQHAHQKGIIHRDLKPGNILVAEQDQKPAPKVIDFGIAKATTGRLSDATIVTETGRLMGTPEYMSPEQAGGAGLGGLDIDSRTDVYSLGVVLYELLTGSLPFDSKTLRSAGYDGLIRMIREADPPRPSTRLATLSADQTAAATRRGLDPRTLRSQLRGDLDWIIAKAMEKDRGRRYSSVSEFAADVERFLRSEPIVARPPSVSYRVQKFVRRNRLAVATAGAVSAAVVLGLAGTSFGMIHARQAEAAAVEQAVRAQQAEEVAVKQKTEAEREAAKAIAAVDFLQTVIGAASPDETSAPNLTVREVLDTAAASLEAEFPKQPEVLAAVRNTLGRTYLTLGLPEKAEPLIRRALDDRRQLLGPDHPDVAQSKNDLGRTLHRRGEYDQAIAALNESLGLRRRVLGENDPQVAATLDNLAAVYFEVNRLDDAETALRSARTIHEQPSGDRVANRINNMRSLAAVYMASGRSAEAERVLRDAVPALRSVLGAEHRDIAQTLNSLGDLLRQEGRLDEADKLLAEAIEMGQRTLPENHPDIGAFMSNRALVLQSKGDLPGAAKLLEQALVIGRAGSAKPAGGRADLDVEMRNLAGVLVDMGEPQRALELARESADRSMRRLPADHPEQGFAPLVIGRAEIAIGRPTEAIQTLTRVVERWTAAFGPDDTRVAIATSCLGEAKLAAGGAAEAKPLLEESFARIDKALGPDHLRTRQAAGRLARLYREAGDAERAAEYERRSKP
jgi:eukaryotic-like serine/threonine-protein kinase